MLKDVAPDASRHSDSNPRAEARNRAGQYPKKTSGSWAFCCWRLKLKVPQTLPKHTYYHRCNNLLPTCSTTERRPSFLNILQHPPGFPTYPWHPASQYPWGSNRPPAQRQVIKHPNEATNDQRQGRSF